ncbi:putative membrane copper tolerance protein [Paramagnetospirillum magnetotacticum MS-1]|uniref:Putative membrane copper tolerance protein n=1 Tax=Paramagnetospirillum magnetotacticum MS-1 TaxID=272627 RepID=A0A0C2UDT9_PARME|nr:sulfite exporter TauE/SafE family protein [Paramagnetospirillum magnetotacticum]KIL99642.1 putative membrane copper tolerance protein [Paramagnetospirillum magnetotacticum MS-1]
MIEIFTNLAHAGMGICRVGIDGNENLLLGLFVTGLVGSLTHCGGMCGPFVLSQCAARMQAIPLERMTEMRRLAGAALLPYHLGRAATYGALGALAASFGGILGGGGSFRLLAAGLLGVAAFLLLAMALPGIKALGGAGGDSRWAQSVGRLAGPLFARPFGLRGWALGVLLGFIPCGLLYAALAAAAAGGNGVAGAFGMLAFWAGTVPMLVLVAMVGQAALSHWRAPLLRAAPALLVLNAGMLGFMAWQLLAS